MSCPVRTTFPLWVAIFVDRGDFGWRFSLHHALNEQPCDLSRPKSYSSFFRIFWYSFRLHSVDSARAGLITVGIGDHNVCKFGCVLIVCLCEPQFLSMYFQSMQSPESISLYRVHPLCATSLPDIAASTWGRVDGATHGVNASPLVSRNRLMSGSEVAQRG